MLDRSLVDVADDVQKGRVSASELAEVNTDGVEPTAQVGVERLPLRPDDARPSLPRERVLAMAPESAGGGFVVPAFIEE